MSLKMRDKNKNKIAVGDIKGLGSLRSVFSEKQEQKLVRHIYGMESRMHGLTVQDIPALAYQLAERTSIKHPFS